jgi:protein involved in polysaccharide export with SLBB domain
LIDENSDGPGLTIAEVRLKRGFLTSFGARQLLLLAVLCSAQVASCTPTGAMRVNRDNVGSTKPQMPDVNTVSTSSMTLEEAERLDHLWQQRIANRVESDYPIGPSDVLVISVPNVKEIQQRKVRVSAQGTIELPLIGFVQAAGMTEEEVAQKIDAKLESIMYKPQAFVFVDEYRNREVAVVGEVTKPGIIVLASRSETVLDVLTQSGGVTSSAADEVIVIPARADYDRAKDSNQIQLAASNSSRTRSTSDTNIGNLSVGSLNGHRLSDEGLELSQPRGMNDGRLHPLDDSKLSHAIRIPLRSNSLTTSAGYLNLPVRPGDVLVVPGGGQVMVVGWVQTPGHFGVGSGLTVLGAIGAAGGPMFAADTGEVTLLRSSQNGSKETIMLDLDKISRGEASDIAVKANDVIDVPYSEWRIGPYVLYAVLTRMGIGGPTIPY